MNDADKFKIYSTMAETTRKWVSVMDAKAGFLSALNVAVIGWLWTPAHMGSATGVKYALGCIATLGCVYSLYLALRAMLPRTNLSDALDKPAQYSARHKPISFFAYVAQNYPKERHEDFMRDVGAMDESVLAREALEQHYTTSHVVQRKAEAVTWAGGAWLAGVLMAAAFLMFPN